MTAGDLRSRITVERKTQQENQFKDTPEKWESVADVWASIQPLRGREQIEAQQITGRTTTKITARWDSRLAAVGADFRIKHGERTFNIVSAFNVDERNKWFEMLCTE